MKIYARQPMNKQRTFLLTAINLASFRLIIFIILINLFHSAFAAENKTIKFLTLSDIHFDPFVSCDHVNIKICPLILQLREQPVAKWQTLLARYDSKVPTYRENTSYKLLISSLHEAGQIAKQQQVKFVLVLGDFIGHNFRDYYRNYTGDKTLNGYQAFVKKTFEFLTQEIARTFPNIDVYPVIGNNDSYIADYYYQASGKFYNEIGKNWAQLIKNKSNQELMLSSFPTAGYYAVNIEDDHMRLIILNSVLFSTNGFGKGIHQAAEKELTWLYSELQQAQLREQKVLLAMHIPPGVDIYASLDFRLLRLLDLWKLEYTRQFEAQLKKFAFEIVGMFAGHLHTDWFQILTLNNVHRIPITGTPSISPIYGNNPGFKVYTYSQTAERFEKFDTYYYHLDDKLLWKKESYNEKNNYKKMANAE